MAEKEYIERDKAIDACFYGWNNNAHDCAENIRSLPAADVRPVVRGRWRFEECDGETCVDGWVCSACGCGFHTHVPYFEDFNFCPNCGADMRPEPPKEG